MHRPWNDFRALLLAVVIALGALALPAQGQILETPREIAAVRLNIIDLLANEQGLPLPIKQRREALRAYYEGANGDLLWLNSSRSGQFLARLADAEADGLSSADYPGAQLARLLDVAPSTDERSLGIIELFFSAALLEYVSDLSVGRFLPGKVDPNFFIQVRSIDTVGALQALQALEERQDVNAYLDEWAPPDPEYGALRTALAQYRDMEARGGWGMVPLGDVLKPGMSDARIPALRARLAVTDAAGPAMGDAEAYDDALVAAVERFQQRHGLEPDGAVGPATLVALNVPVGERIRSIELAMERWRWMPRELGARYVMVNIAGFDLKRVEGGAVAERMPVVVGKPYSRTPVFSDAIRYLEFNPYWTVPTGIAIKEELPKLVSNPSGLASQGFEAVAGGQSYDLRAIDWSRYGAGNFPFQLRQKPGANNALGRVKFMFPNSHDVYLHDTPSRSLFGRAERAFSHGCIRVSRPLELADAVLRDSGVAGWDGTRIDAVVGSDKNTVVTLSNPLPIHITYLTAWVEDGVVNFRKDIYEHDTKLVAALDGKSIAW